MSDKKFFARFTLISRPKDVIISQLIDELNIQEFIKSFDKRGIEYIQLVDHAGVTTIVYTRDISTVTIHED